jgi:hypothetical protein
MSARFNISSGTEEQVMSAKKWSRQVGERSNALDLDKGVFTWKDPTEIARSLKHSTQRSHRRKHPIPVGNVNADLLHQSGR